MAAKQMRVSFLRIIVHITVIGFKLLICVMSM